MQQKPLILWAVIFLVCVLAAAHAASAEKDRPAETITPQTARAEGVKFELEWDAYYTSAAAIISMTDDPISKVGEKNEFDVYRDLLKHSFVPSHLLLEASVYPMPCLGSLIKQDQRGFYEDAEVADGFNLLKAVTAGFDEPYAISLFTGNVVSFEKKGEKRKAGNNGYMGYLVSAGDYHIKENEFIYDKWCELEWKLKGDRVFSNQTLSWSFRVGTKIHDHPEITDSVYISLRRSRLDFEAPADSILKNSGFEYTFSATEGTFKPISHYFSVDKKWPLKDKKLAFSLVLGFVWETDRKYTGTLSRNKDSDFQVFIRPNFYF
ncbi:MAG: hypothetical protein SWH68_14255 [Thermodesulfobacteriota bacterium]|nr:hypothetical protein [Thermodesulfobacteriota bacterium]